MTVRRPDVTRRQILEAAFAEIHVKGFQAASLAAILDSTGLTKGALYHHFADKKALGYAVVDELLRDFAEEYWLGPLRETDDPVATIQRIFRTTHTETQDVCLGCPVNNLAQEMSPIDEGFRRRLHDLFTLWTDGIAEALERGKRAGTVRADVDAGAAGRFVVAAHGGCRIVAKNAQSPETYLECVETLAGYLDTLRP